MLFYVNGNSKEKGELLLVEKKSSLHISQQNNLPAHHHRPTVKSMGRSRSQKREATARRAAATPRDGRGTSKEGPVVLLEHWYTVEDTAHEPLPATADSCEYDPDINKYHVRYLVGNARVANDGIGHFVFAVSTVHLHKEDVLRATLVDGSKTYTVLLQEQHVRPHRLGLD